MKRKLVHHKQGDEHQGKVANIKIGIPAIEAKTKTPPPTQCAYLENMKQVLSKCMTRAYVVRCPYANCPFQLIYFNAELEKGGLPTGKNRWLPTRVTCKACGAQPTTQTLRCIVCNKALVKTTAVCHCTANDILQAVETKLKEKNYKL